MALSKMLLGVALELINADINVRQFEFHTEASTFLPYSSHFKHYHSRSRFDLHMHALEKGTEKQFYLWPIMKRIIIPFSRSNRKSFSPAQT